MVFSFGSSPVVPVAVVGQLITHPNDETAAPGCDTEVEPGRSHAEARADEQRAPRDAAAR
jgi:hypothetical protein